MKQDIIQLTKSESEKLTNELNAKRDPFKFEPIYHALTDEDILLYQKDTTFVEEINDVEELK